MNGQSSESDRQRMRLAIEANPVPGWEGDLDDDCTASWAGFTLRAEKMDRRVWWWAVYLDANDSQIGSSNETGISPVSGAEARAAAVAAVRSFLKMRRKD